MKNKPTKRQIQIVEHFVKKTTKSMMNEASGDPNWNAITNAFVKFLQHNTKILNGFVQAKDYEKTKRGVESIISGLTNAQDSLLK